MKIVNVWPSSREIAMESRCSPFTNSIQWSWAQSCLVASLGYAARA